MFLFQYKSWVPTATEPPVLNPSETGSQTRISDICKFARCSISPLQHNDSREKVYRTIGKLEKAALLFSKDEFSMTNRSSKKADEHLQAVQLLDQLISDIAQYRSTLAPKSQKELDNSLYSSGAFTSYFGNTRQMLSDRSYLLNLSITPVPLIASRPPWPTGVNTTNPGQSLQVTSFWELGLPHELEQYASDPQLLYNDLVKYSTLPTELTRRTDPAAIGIALALRQMCFEKDAQTNVSPREKADNLTLFANLYQTFANQFVLFDSMDLSPLLPDSPAFRFFSKKRGASEQKALDTMLDTLALASVNVYRTLKEPETVSMGSESTRTNVKFLLPEHLECASRIKLDHSNLVKERTGNSFDSFVSAVEEGRAALKHGKIEVQQASIEGDIVTLIPFVGTLYNLGGAIFSESNATGYLVAALICGLFDLTTLGLFSSVGGAAGRQIVKQCAGETFSKYALEKTGISGVKNFRKIAGEIAENVQKELLSTEITRKKLLLLRGVEKEGQGPIVKNINNQIAKEISKQYKIPLDKTLTLVDANISKKIVIGLEGMSQTSAKSVSLGLKGEIFSMNIGNRTKIGKVVFRCGNESRELIVDKNATGTVEVLIKRGRHYEMPAPTIKNGMITFEGGQSVRVKDITVRGGELKGITKGTKPGANEISLGGETTIKPRSGVEPGEGWSPFGKRKREAKDINAALKNRFGKPLYVAQLPSQGAVVGLKYVEGGIELAVWESGKVSSKIFKRSTELIRELVSLYKDGILNAKDLVATMADVAKSPMVHGNWKELLMGKLLAQKLTPEAIGQVKSLIGKVGKSSPKQEQQGTAATQGGSTGSVEADTTTVKQGQTLVPISSVSGLSATYNRGEATETHNVSVTWTPVKEAADGYKIYRNGEPQVNGAVVGGSLFSDPGVGAGTYTYKVVPVVNGKEQDDKSATCQITVGGQQAAENSDEQLRQQIGKQAMEGIAIFKALTKEQQGAIIGKLLELQKRGVNPIGYISDRESYNDIMDMLNGY